MNKELQELKQQLDKWIRNTNPDLATDNDDKIKSFAELSTLLIVRDWVTSKLTKNIKK